MKNSFLKNPKIGQKSEISMQVLVRAYESGYRIMRGATELFKGATIVRQGDILEEVAPGA